LSGSAIAGVEGVDWLFSIGRHVLSLLIFGSTATFGMRPSWEVRWLALPLMPFILIFWIGVLAYIGWRLKTGENNRIGVWTLFGVLITLALGFIFTPFGADPSGRYFLPWAIPLALFASDMLNYLKEKIGRFIWGLLVLVLAYNLWGTLQSANRFPPGLTTQFDAVTQIDHRYMPFLIDFLRENSEERGYTNYWVAYPLAYYSDEELIYIPRIPYHQDFRYTPRDDRYAPYNLDVAKAKKVVYITTNHVLLNDYLRNSFLYGGISWEEIGIGDYYIFYNLSDVVRPEDIGLGTLTNP
jgi:4-amino-4-deoxy-L-arabinose transferase-like glycosyltransferase